MSNGIESTTPDRIVHPAMHNAAIRQAIADRTSEAEVRAALESGDLRSRHPRHLAAWQLGVTAAVITQFRVAHAGCTLELGASAAPIRATG